jgi:uncharacterized protein (TIGR03437 family)
MQIRMFKLLIIGVFCVLFAYVGLTGSPVGAFSGGPPASHTDAPGEQNCTTCHFGNGVNTGGGTLTISGLPANYIANQEVAVTVTLSQPNRARYGFQVTVVDDQGRAAGDLVVTDTNRTQRITSSVGGNQRQYIEHTFAGITPSATGQNSWTFTWRSPAQSTGRVTFYVAGNAANGNNQQTGDFIYTTSQSVQPGSPPLAQFASVSAASFAPDGSLAPNAIAAGFGTGLSQNTVVATSLPLPTQLDGTEVKVRGIDNVDRSAGLFFVAPGQINYLIPAGTPNGEATITVRRGGNDIAQGAEFIESVAPGLFGANANGQGVAAAVVLRRRGTVDTFEPVAQLNSATGRFEPLPIDLGPNTDQVFLIAFGTGFRNVSSQSAVTCTIGGTNAEVLGVAAVAGFEGLDQANISIPRSLAGRGVVDVVLRADNKTANTVQISIR